MPRTADENGALWGARAEAWAEQEKQSEPMYELAIRRAGIGDGTRVLDVGCGAGSFCALAAELGARVVGLDAADALLHVARRRVPSGDFRHGDLESLPFDDDSFDVVTGFNAFQFGDDPATALAEARRVARPAATVVVVVWAEPERVDLAAVMRAVSVLAPSRPAGRPSLSDAGALESLAGAVGLDVRESGVGSLCFEWPERDSMLRGLTSAGGMVRVAQAVGDERLAEAVTEAMAPFRTSDGGYRLRNDWRFVLAGA